MLGVVFLVIKLHQSINFGYQGTTGQEGIDYIICDQFIIPQEQEDFYLRKNIPDCSYFPRDNNRQTSNKKFNKRFKYTRRIICFL